ncbi:MAG: GNAT family N-acetyltransferase [Oscillospiraceae bacterium]|nr:GNAT family N-acetyltransferase [Oscillospiraceae bacterium]
MELIKITAESSEEVKILIDELNQQAFPDNERLDTEIMFLLAKENRINILGIYAEEEFCGFFVIYVFQHLAYISFFAICPEKRSKGIGSQALQLLRKYYANSQIVVDFEAPNENVLNNLQRIRRRKFYYKNHFFETGWYQFYANTEFEIACSEPEFDKTDFEALIADIHALAPEFNPYLYRKN